jgi:hypothetical protein
VTHSGNHGEADENLAVEVVWSGDDAATYVQLVAASQTATIGKRRQPYSALTFVAFALGFGGLTVWLTGSPMWATIIMALLFAFVLAFTWARYFDNHPRQLAKSLHASDPAAYPPRRITLTASSLHDERDGMQTITALTAVTHVTRQNGLLLAWTSKSAAMAIPERCFGSAAEADAFVAALQTRMAAAKAQG